MSIPIPLVLALLSKKTQSKSVNNSNHNPSNTQTALVKKSTNNASQLNNDSVRKLKGVAQIMGGSRGAQLSRIANIMNTSRTISTPMNALSMIANNKLKNSILPVATQGLQGNSLPQVNNLYSGINSMLSNMDNQKKEELMNMAQNLMKNMK